MVGKGGVGKTTAATALASRCAARGERTLLLSTDPARTLASVVETTLTSEPVAVSDVNGLFAAQLDPEAARIAFLARHRDTLLTIFDRGTYLDGEDSRHLVDTTLPGGDETFAALTLAGLARDTSWDRVVIDTAPTGHTLRLLALPEVLGALVRLLDAFQEKHRMMVRALTHRYRADAADAFLKDMREQVAGLRAGLLDAKRTAAVLVTRAEPVVLAETRRYVKALERNRVHLAAVLANAVSGEEERAAIHELTTDLVTVPVTSVSRLADPPATMRGAMEWARAIGDPSWGAPPSTNLPDASRGSRTRSPRAKSSARNRPAPSEPATISLLLRPLTIVAGKGGVGKTTVSCALAIVSARSGARTLLVSTDPAPSIADALDLEVGEDETDIAGVPGLVARQLDAAASFARFRESYGERVGDVMRAVAPLAATDDVRVIEDLLALAPPGIDELYALAWLGEALESDRFDRVVLDPAPTGHLLRLLEMPVIALEWTHQIMRLMLKYKNVVRLGDAAEELMGFARRTRSVDALLRDSERAGAVVVALDEPLVRGETTRLVGALRGMNVSVTGVVWNRMEGDRTPEPLALDPPLSQYAVSATHPSPRGALALEQWSTGWRKLVLANR